MNPPKKVLWIVVTACIVLFLAGCAIQPAKQEDPLQSMNRKVFAFNEKVDNYVVKPIAKGYVKITSANVRSLVSNFYSNLLLPISIVNDLLQARVGGAAEDTGRLVVNSTIGLAGLFDPANKLGLKLDETDFGVTLARWGVPQGPYLVIPFLGPSSFRDVWSDPVDSYLLNPMTYWIRDNNFKYHAEYLPLVLYDVQLRASYLNADTFLDSSYDPYILVRNAYLQHRNFLIYHGSPPLSVIESEQGLGPTSQESLDAISAQQRAWQAQQAAKNTAGKAIGPKPKKKAGAGTEQSSPVAPSSTSPTILGHVPAAAGI